MFGFGLIWIKNTAAYRRKSYTDIFCLMGICIFAYISITKNDAIIMFGNALNHPFSVDIVGM